MEIKERLSLILILLTIGACLASVAQTPVFFTNESNRIDNNFSSGVTLAVSDVNNDYRDDLIRVSKTHLVVHAQLNEGRLFKEQYKVALPFSVSTINVGNINAKGFNDIFLSGFKKGFLTVEMKSDYENYEIIQEMDGSYYAQGSSINDINLDGFLDVLVTNDIGFNQTFVNDGNGHLELNEDIIDFKLNTESESAGNYNSIWFDADQDNDLDLFISKCFVSATSEFDLQRINQLYINDNGVFKESAAEFGLAHGDQTWCADSADLDNDGDIDLIIINHGSPSLLLENTGDNSFNSHDLFSSNGMIVSDDLQVTLEDYNNDGLIDISIAGNRAQMLLNKGNLQFESYTNAFGFGNMTSMATGDLNNDGWLDILGVYGVAGSDLEDRLLLNLGGANHSITLSLRGKESNINGIGSKIEIFHGGKKQVRWSDSGVSYGITNSLNVHFGLGDAEKVDSIICYWPQGIVDTFYNLEVDKHYILSEGDCIEPLMKIAASNDFIDCKNETVSVTNSLNKEVLWNQSNISEGIQVMSTGYYSAASIANCFNVSNVIYIDTLRMLDTPKLTYAGELKLCSNDEFILTTMSHKDWDWLKDDTYLTSANEIIVSAPGVYKAYTANNCDTVYSGGLIFEHLDLNFPSKSDTINSISNITLTSPEADSISWYDSNQMFVTDEKELELFDIDSDTLFYFRALSKPTKVNFDVFPNIDSMNTIFASNQLLGGLGFRVNSKCLIKTVRVETDTEGERQFLVINSNNDTLFNEILKLELGQNELLLNVILNRGDYKITTDVDFNEITLGHKSPRLSSVSANDIRFPISVNGYIDLEYSLSGLGDFSQFFNWQVEPIFENCISDFIPCSIVLDSLVSNITLVDTDFRLFPNPTYDHLIWDAEKKWDKVEILNVAGGNVIKQLFDLDISEINVEFLSQGLYFIRFTLNDKVIVKSFFKL